MSYATRCTRRGYRVGEVTLETTLLNASVYSAEALAELYFRRWQVEVYLRDFEDLH